MAKNIKAYMYLRKSRAEELEDTTEDTLRRHKETLTAFAAKNNISVLGVYEEVVSGESLYARPEMLRLLETVENSPEEGDAVLCMDIDRLGRGGMSDQGIILETLKYSGTKIITPRKIYDLNNEMDEEYTEFETFMARRELKTIKRRLRQGLQKTLEEGGYIANAPYGYEKTVKDKLPTLKIVENEAEFVRMIFRLYVDDLMGADSIAQKINAMGAKPRRSESFTKSSVIAIIRNSVYVGKIVWNKKTHVRKNTRNNSKHITIYNPQDKWTYRDGVHPAIIDDDTFQRAQEILSGRYHAPANKGILYNPLSGLVFCSKCGKAMVRRKYTQWGKQVGHINFICTTAGCAPYSRMEEVEAAVIGGVQNMLDQIKQSGLAVQRKKSTNQFEQSLQMVQKELRSLIGQKDGLYNFLETGVYTVEVFQQRFAALGDRIAKVERQEAELQDKIKQEQARDLSAAALKIESVLAAYEFADVHEQNELLKSIINRIEFVKEPGWKTEEFELIMYYKGISGEIK